MSSEAWVYLLRCADGSLYTGWTVDLDRRLARHAAGTASAYTRSRRPVALALALPMPDRSSARREEARIKALPRAAKLALVAGDDLAASDIAFEHRPPAAVS
jgi:predicted GIY-YIG superfamily endonuclease